MNTTSRENLSSRHNKMADIEMTDINGAWKVGPENDRGRTLPPRLRPITIVWLVVTLLLFWARHCLYPFEDYLHLLPAITYTTILVVTVILYVIRFILQWILYRRHRGDPPKRPSLSLQNIPRIAVVAGLIILERLIYRYAYEFALGLELTVLKAALPFTFLLISLRNTSGLAAYSLPTIGVIATVAALFGATHVSLHAFLAGVLINVILVWIILRTAQILADISLTSFFFQLCIILVPAFWLLAGSVNDNDWLNFYKDGTTVYMLANGILGALQFLLGSILIRDSPPTFHIPTFALGSILTDLQARFLLRQSFFSIASLGLVVAATTCTASILRPSPPGKRSTAVPKLAVVGIGAAILLHVLIFGIYFLAQDHQPIISLMDHASAQFHDYSTASASISLHETVVEYNRRYGRPPPPGFDIWYQFASDRGSKVIHDYDQIMEDLKPFWAIEPRVLRERVTRAASNEKNQLGQISIRGGKAEITVAPQWLWMPEQMIRMINMFITWLPDMDILLNENDECRVVIPWAEKQALLEKEKENRIRRADDKYVNWYTQIEWFGRSKVETTDFVDLSEKPVWDFSIQGCPPNSPAHSPILSGPHLQAVCMDPHTSVSAFRSTRYVSNYTRSADICYQPDLRFQSGFFMAPAAFLGTHIPIPIFSQSRVEPYNDILAPSPWHYSGRSRYEDDKDHIWKERYDVFFWRGANTNGISTKGGWRFHLRERFVKISRILRGQVDVGFTEITRCRGEDCREEEHTFDLKNNVQFEEFFKYKFLPDLDGAAFSGRWVSFLMSRGLPFKMAIFREWFDSRIIAWRHYVPLDVRLRGRDFKTVVDWFMREENYRFSKKVADWGREWTLGTLRDQDAEIYMFRLLLEYARVMNDDRDKLGFTLNE